MIALVELTILGLVTMFALAAASGLHWLLLQAAFLLMRPAAARRMPAHAELAHGTARLARAYSASR